MARSMKVGDLAGQVMKELKGYAKIATEDLKQEIRQAASTVKKEIKDTAPKKSGTYKDSWVASKSLETADSIGMTVHSPKRYMIAHLLENGHAKRGGGRVPGIPHIAPAEEAGREQLMRELEEKLKG